MNVDKREMRAMIAALETERQIAELEIERLKRLVEDLVRDVESVRRYYARELESLRAEVTKRRAAESRGRKSGGVDRTRPFAESAMGADSDGDDFGELDDEESHDDRVDPSDEFADDGDIFPRAVDACPFNPSDPGRY